MNEFDAGKSDPGGGFGFKAEDGSDALFDSTIILFRSIVHVFAGPDSDGLASSSQPVLCIALHDGHAVGLSVSAHLSAHSSDMTVLNAGQSG